MRTLRRIVNLAHDWGVIDNRPVIHEVPGGRGRSYVISFEDELEYLNRASSTLRELAILAADTGLRPNSELFSLRWEDVELEEWDGAPRGFIHVAKGKTKHAVRNVPLTTRAREVLLHRKQQNPNSQYVFGGNGSTGHIVTIQHAHERVIKKAGIDYFEFYCWRHTFGTRMAESGVDRFALARLMGHSSPTVAERYYVHVTESHVTTGFEKFEAYRNAMDVRGKREFEESRPRTDRLQ